MKDINDTIKYASNYLSRVVGLFIKRMINAFFEYHKTTDNTLTTHIKC